MDLYKRDLFISRIMAGHITIYVNKSPITIYGPDIATTLRANEIYCKHYRRAIEGEILTQKQLLHFLIINDLWSEQKEQEYQEILPKHIEYWKMELYTAILKSKTRDTVRKYLQVAKDEFARLHQERSIYEYMTCEGYASYVKNMFTISKCSRAKGKKVNWKKHDLNLVMNTYHSEMLDSDTIRMLARTQPWSGLWSVLKINGRIFENNTLTAEQQALISWSIMYDKIYESPDCPPDAVVEDDDMLDGWLLIQKKQRDNERKKQEVEGVVSDKISNADEIFIVAETPEDASKIDLLNPAHVKRIKNKRLSKIKKQGVVKQQEFDDVRLERSIAMQQALQQQIKGK